MFSEAIEIIARDENVAGIIVLRKVTTPVEEPSLEILRAISGKERPIVACWIGEEAQQIIRAVQKEGIPTYPTADRAASAMAGLVRYAEIKRTKGG